MSFICTATNPLFCWSPEIGCGPYKTWRVNWKRPCQLKHCFQCSLSRYPHLITCVCESVFSMFFATGVINDPVEFAIFAYVDTWAGLGWVGWGWWRFLRLHTCGHATHLTFHALAQGWDMLRKSWGEGWVTFLSLAHMWHATHLTFLALAHMWHATQVMGEGWVGGVEMMTFLSLAHMVTCYALDVSCTCTHVTCYASHGEGWVGGVGMMTFLSLCTHVTVLRTWRFLHLHTCGTLKLDWQGLKR